MDPATRRPETWALEQWIKESGFDVSQIGIVLDIGSYDCLEAIELERIFDSQVFAFEANPASVDKCFKTVMDGNRHRIGIVPKAVNSYTGHCKFYPINEQYTDSPWLGGNPGASSMYVASGEYPHEHYVQDIIEVPCTRIDDYLYSIGDTVGGEKVACWLDCQGHEKVALESMGEYLNDVRLIWTEVSHKAAYTGQVLFTELNSFLISRGFELRSQIVPDEWQHDALYVRP